ncbi:hypothetical protein DL96DRAFT_1639584 [Flagelloscypha sp. PMI_526]|nr:hypothetical protein DL96DRAFT_1639584 [Flagelloscypha sp. PMI_526]
MEPLLPPELEERIFRISALSNPSMILTLLLVASRVNKWIERIRFHSLIFKLENFSSTIRLIESKNAEFLAQHVHYCCIDILQELSETRLKQFQHILMSFIGLKGLALWSYWPGGVIAALPLDLSRFPNLTLLSLCRSKVPASAFPAPSSNVGITHITWDLSGACVLEELIHRSQLPQLTHILWNIGDDALITLEWERRASLVRILKFPMIQCVLMYIRDMTGTETRYIDAIPELGSPSVVFFFFNQNCDFHDWKRITSDECDCWMHAEAIIRARHQVKQSPV